MHLRRSHYPATGPVMLQPTILTFTTYLALGLYTYFFRIILHSVSICNAVSHVKSFVLLHYYYYYYYYFGYIELMSVLAWNFSFQHCFYLSRPLSSYMFLLFGLLLRLFCMSTLSAPSFTSNLLNNVIGNKFLTNVTEEDCIAVTS